MKTITALILAVSLAACATVEQQAPEQKQERTLCKSGVRCAVYSGDGWQRERDRMADHSPAPATPNQR